MEKSKVYYTDFRTTIGVGLPQKLAKLCRKAGMLGIGSREYELIKM